MFFQICPTSGCSAARLARSSGGRKAGGSNPLIPTKNCTKIKGKYGY